MDVLGLTAAEKNAAYQGIKDYVLEHSGWKVSNCSGEAEVRYHRAWELP